MAAPEKNNYVFKRIETKYLLTRWQYELLKSEMRSHMIEDEYGLSKICNIYYDTDDYSLIRESIEKPNYKEKFRLRSYGIPDSEDSPVYLEIKKKYDGVVYKRRIRMNYLEAQNYLSKGIRPAKESQILHEIDYFFKYHQPKPMMYIAYDRIATYDKDDPSLRITFDFNIRNRNDDPDFSHGDKDFNLLFKNGEVLMEIKVGGAYPLWLSEMLSRLNIYPISFSKYGFFYKQLLEQKGSEASKIELEKMNSHIIHFSHNDFRYQQMKKYS